MPNGCCLKQSRSLLLMCTDGYNQRWVRNCSNSDNSHSLAYQLHCSPALQVSLLTLGWLSCCLCNIFRSSDWLCVYSVAWNKTPTNRLTLILNYSGCAMLAPKSCSARNVPAFSWLFHKQKHIRAITGVVTLYNNSNIILQSVVAKHFDWTRDIPWVLIYTLTAMGRLTLCYHSASHVL